MRLLREGTFVLITEDTIGGLHGGLRMLEAWYALMVRWRGCHDLSEGCPGGFSQCASFQGYRLSHIGRIVIGGSQCVWEGAWKSAGEWLRRGGLRTDERCDAGCRRALTNSKVSRPSAGEIPFPPPISCAELTSGQARYDQYMNASVSPFYERDAIEIYHPVILITAPSYSACRRDASRSVKPYELR